MEAENREYGGIRVKVDVDTSSLDSAIEKANRLASLLREANSLIDSLSSGSQSKGLAGFKSEVTLSAKEITGAVLEAIRDKR